MADNVAITPGAGATIATDDVGGVQFQRVKLDVGGDGVSVPVAGSMPVTPATNATTTREYTTTAALRQSVTTSTSTFGLPTLGATREIYIHAISARMYFRTGDAAVTASVAAAHHVVESGEKFHWRVPLGHTHLAVIGDGASGVAIVNAVA